MRILGRYIQLQSIPQKLFQLVHTVAQMLVICKSPFGVMYGYLFKKHIPSTIKLRNGILISLSGNANDIVTFVTIFCRKEYSQVKKGQPVIDVGANIGLFTLYAAIKGASKIISVEPNAESFETLEKNITANKLQNVIAVKKAVSSKSGESLYIPRSSNPENVSQKEMPPGAGSHYVQVETVSLPDLLKQHHIAEAVLLKMDCEGAEYDILLSLTAQEMDPIQTISMEYHAESRSLVNHFCNNGFRITRLKPIINTKIQTGMLEAVRV